MIFVIVIITIYLKYDMYADTIMLRSISQCIHSPHLAMHGLTWTGRPRPYTGHTCHILPPSEIDLGLCLAVFAGSGGK